MIVCHCNVLSDRQILAAVDEATGLSPVSPVAAYRCLGCSPKCGRCFATVRALLEGANAACAVGCAVCPAQEHDHAHPHLPALEAPQLIAAE